MRNKDNLRDFSGAGLRTGVQCMVADICNMGQYEHHIEPIG